MGRKKKTNDGGNTENPELKTASEVLSKVEVKPARLSPKPLLTNRLLSITT